jgi:hypothetical protein
MITGQHSLNIKELFHDPKMTGDEFIMSTARGDGKNQVCFNG